MKLQGRSIDVVQAYRDISMVKAALKEARCGSEKFHEIVYSDAVALAHSVGIEESYPRIASYTKSIGQIHLQLMLASITAGPFNY